MKAQELRDNPTDEVREFAAIAKEHSARSESTVQKDWEFDDRSILSVRSHAGGEVEAEVWQRPPHAEELTDGD